MEDDTTCNAPRWSDSSSPAESTGQQRDTVAAQPGQQVDHVVVGDEGVGEADEGLRQSSSPSLLLGGHRSSFSNRNRRPTTSRATSSMGRSCTNADARNLLNAASGDSANWTMIIPVAW